MRFQSAQNTTFANTGNSSVVINLDLPSFRRLLEAGSRLGAILPQYVESQALHPLTRLASFNVVRAQVRQCIATLDKASTNDLTSLRARLSQAVKSIHNAPNEATARALYGSQQVQEALWAWAAAEASTLVRSMTRNAPIDTDKQADLVGDAVMGFIREEAKRAGQDKLNPFSMARTWDESRMADPLATLRKYLQAWCKNVVQVHYRQQINEGTSLDAPADGTGIDGGPALSEVIQDRQNVNPETAILDRADHRSQTAAMIAMYERQIAGLERDILALGNRTDAYSLNKKSVLTNRLDAIKEMVAPLLRKLQQTAEELSAAETDHTLSADQRERRLIHLNKQFETAMSNLTAISDAQERAHGRRIMRDGSSIQALHQQQRDLGPQGNGSAETEPAAAALLFRNKKPISDPLTTERAYAHARENAERLLPHVYRSLTHRKNTDLSEKYTSNLLINWRLLDGIDSRRDLDAVLSSDPDVRATANDRALFSTTALRVMMILRDVYTYDEKYSAIRGEEENVPKNAKQRFIQLMGKEIERAPSLHARAPQLLDLLKGFVVGNAFRTLWENIDYTARTGAYEWARNEKVNKRWDKLLPEEANKVADTAGHLLYDNQHRPFSAWSQGDSQQRVTRDLNLTPTERQEIMRQEVERIKAMMRGDIARGTWAHGEPLGGRFHDKPRARQSAPSVTNNEDAYTTSTSAPIIRTRRFASKYAPFVF